MSQAKLKSKIVHLKILLNFPLVLWLLANVNCSASAQIIPDNTLTTNTEVKINGSTFNIDGGTREGNNLFHSFEQFSLLTGQTASFNNPIDIQNIISRVTGNSSSNIDGLISAEGTANLFLINPNGIIFGANASLNIGGSFIGSTANSIRFADGSEFSASNRNPPPKSLLTINIPLGLQYGPTNTGVIRVNGTGNNLSFHPDNLFVIRNSRPVGLQVQSEKTLALVGGNVEISGGNLTAQGGRIELGSVGTDSLVKLNPITSGWELSYENVNNFQDISLSQAASLEVSGNSGGTIQVQGRNIQVKEASAMLADTLGNGLGGTLKIKASDFVEASGASVSLPFVTYLSTDVALGATGNGGNLLIDTPSLRVADGAQISSGTFSSGNGGTLTVKAQQVELTGDSPVARSSGLFTPVAPGATGNGGNLFLETNDLLINNGAEVVATTFGLGNGGSMTLNATNILLSGATSGGIASGIFANSASGSLGTGGKININTQNLQVADGASIAVTTFSSKDGGILTLKAKEIEVLRGAASVGSSGIFANSASSATGNGGTLLIDTDSLRIAGGGQIAVSTFGSGNGGSVKLNATNIELSGASRRGVPSGLFANVGSTATGNGGSLTIDTQSLRLINGAQIGTGTFGSGNGGEVKIQATDVELIGTSSTAPSLLFTAVQSNATGKGGNLTLDTTNLRLTDGGQITSGTLGSGKAGNLSVNATDIEVVGFSEKWRSGLFASAIQSNGDGGNLSIATDNLTIKDGGIISASNFPSLDSSISPGQGKAGNIQIEAGSILLDSTSLENPASITASTTSGGGGNIFLQVQNSLTANNGSQISADTQGSGNGGNIQVSSDSLKLTNQGRISTNSAGLGQAGNITINSNQIQANQGKILATSTQTGGGNLNLNTNLLLLNNNSLISTSVLDSTGGGGNINANAGFVVANNNSDIRANAVFGSGGSIQIQTQGIFLSSDSEIDASSQFGVNGIVTITNLETSKKIANNQLPDNIIDSSVQIAASCQANRANNFVITGRGGLPENPTDTIFGKTIWTDLRDLSPKVAQEKKGAAERQETASPVHQNQPSVIIEAQTWVVNRNGQVELVTNSANMIPQASSRLSACHSHQRKNI